MSAATDVTALEAAWQELAGLLAEANALGAEFRIHGDRIDIRGLQALPAPLAAGLRQHRELAWHFLGAARVDNAARNFFAGLGVALVVSTSAEEAEQALADLAEMAAQQDRTVALDIETAPRPQYAVPRPAIRINKDGALSAAQPPLEDRTALDPHRARIATVQLYAGGDRVYLFRGSAVATVLASQFLRTAHLIVHGATFELGFLQSWRRDHPLEEDGIARGRIDCSLQAAGLIKGIGFGGEGRNLEASAQHFLGLMPPKALGTSDWSAPSLSRGQLAYAAADAVLVHRLWPILKADLERTGRQEAYELQRRAGPAVADMKLRGFLLDQDEHTRQVARWTHELTEARKAYADSIGSAAPETTRQLQQWLRAVLTPQQIEVWPRTNKSGELSTESKHLKRLIEVPGTPPVLAILAKRKLLSSFGLRLLEHVNPATGRIHPDFAIAASKAGRFACYRPNLQQVPSTKAPEFRRCIVAAPGHLLVGCDWSQIELRAAAWLSRDPELTRLYEEGRDLHRETAAAITGLPAEQVTKEQREAAKPVNFGAIYGIGPRALAQSAFDKYEIVLTEQEARHALDRFFRRFSQLERYLRTHAEQCQREGVVRIGAGRVVEAAWEPNGRISFPQACNLPVQGIAADAMLRAIPLVHARLHRHGIAGGMIATVHDELLLEVVEADAALACSILHQAMVDAFVATFPGAPSNGVAVVTLGRCWGDMQEYQP